MRVLKIGGSFITDKSAYMKALPENIGKMANAVSSVWKKGARDLVVVHGAGSFGHAPVIRHRIDGGVRTEAHRLGFADTHASCSALSLMLVNAFIAEGVPAITIPPAAIIEQKNKRIERFDENAIASYLSAGYLPVLHGDVVPDSELGGSVCSGDQIMAWLGRKAKLLVFVTNVDGVLDDKGKVVPEITKANFAEISGHLKESQNDVTGAMKGKVRELLGIAAESCIVNGAAPDRVLALLSGKDAICTRINPKKR